MVTPRAGRQLVAERGLTAAAVAALIPLMSEVGFEELGLVKALLKRFFSADAWTAIDAAALSRAVGPPPPGEGEDVRMIQVRLDPDVTLVAGWVDGSFAIDVEVEAAGPEEADDPEPSLSVDFGPTFDSSVTPEPTPNPRTLRFATPPRTLATSRAYRRGDPLDDERVAAVFAVADDVLDVLVGADFVAVSLQRPDRWPGLLEPVLAVIDAGFGGETTDPAPADPDAPPVDAGLDVRAGGGARRPPASGATRRPSRLEQAWNDLGRLHPRDPADLAAVVDAARDADGARRQVAASLLGEAPDDVAASLWADLLGDGSRLVRRAAVDAVVDAGREELRPLLERALRDADAWIRWKALHGLVVLGVEPSLDALEPLGRDPDFRVRLEAANARRRS